MHSRTFLVFATAIGFAAAWAMAQTAPPHAKPVTGDWRSAIQQRIEADYPLTQPTGDKTDIVTAGAVIVLKKNSLVMHQATAPLSNANTYKGGKLSAGFFGTLCKNAQDGSCRTFVKGEKFWLTEVDVKEDGLNLQFLSDALPDTRYSGTLKFPFAKGTQPTPDEMAAVVAEVIGTDRGPKLNRLPPPLPLKRRPHLLPHPSIRLPLPSRPRRRLRINPRHRRLR